MRTVGCLSVLAILPLTFAATARAQAPVPPPTGVTAPPPVLAPAPQATTAPASPSAAPTTSGQAPVASAPPPATAQPTPAPAAAPATSPAPQPGAAQPPATATTAPANGAQPAATTEATFAGEATMGGASAAGAVGENQGQPVDEQAFYQEHRESSLNFGNSLSGAVGLLHMQTPFSGAAGTFRASFLTGYYSGSGFLCNSETMCLNSQSQADPAEDSAKSVSSDIAISATLTSYLEAYVGMHSMASSNTRGKPQLLQVVGDTNLGLKLFTPAKPDRILALGTSIDLWMLNGSGNLGISNADFTLRGMASIDLTRRSDPKQRIPLRLHGSLGYLFDGSGSLVDDTESTRNARVSRIERFGLEINRVDSFLLGIGAEYVSKVVQPFLEWTFDIPTNYRLNYSCSSASNGQRYVGDDCLKNASGFSSTPSRLTLGTRVTPPSVRGLQGLVAFDIGTGATSKFIEEVAPELPWRIFFGIAFAHDIGASAVASGPPQIVERVVQAPPPPEYRVVGLVLDERTQQPIANAVVKYQGQSLTGMVARQDGSFETGNLQPGTYSFAVTADGYREGLCTVSIAAAPAGAAPATPAAAATTSAAPAMDAFGNPVPPSPTATATPAAPASTLTAAGPVITNVACPLKPMPAVGAIQGALIDAETNMAVPGARLTIRDAKGRELALDADGAGAFRFENVPVGSVKISIDAEGYMPANIEQEVRAKSEARPTVALNKRPKKPNVVVTPTEVKLSKQVHFANDSATIVVDSMALVQEIALTLKEHPELLRIEIQGHTDNTGLPTYNKRLSQERAEAVRNALISLGVESSKLTAMGYGQDRSLVPNSTEANKAKNRRVQLMILEKK